MFAHSNGEADSGRAYQFLAGPALDIGSSKYHDTNNNTALNSTLRAMASLTTMLS
jgi:hypothetical protein